jgi:hypothetical protein
VNKINRWFKCNQEPIFNNYIGTFIHYLLISGKISIFQFQYFNWHSICEHSAHCASTVSKESFFDSMGLGSVRAKCMVILIRSWALDCCWFMVCTPQKSLWLSVKQVISVCSFKLLCQFFLLNAPQCRVVSKIHSSCDHSRVVTHLGSIWLACSLN